MLDLTRQSEDLVESFAVVLGGGDHALGPQTLGLQLVHLLAGVHGVLAGDHPVVGGGGDDDPNPSDTAQQDTREQPAASSHNPVCTVQTGVWALSTNLQLFFLYILIFPYFSIIFFIS